MPTLHSLPLRIAIDGAFMTTRQPGGYKTYSTNLVHALAEYDKTNEFRLLVDNQTELELPPNWRVDTVSRRGSAGFIWREQVKLAQYCRNENVDVLHAPAATGPLQLPGPLVVTIHDTIEFTDPLPSIRQTKRWAMRQYSRLIQAQTVKKASHILTVSAYSKQQIIARFGVSPDRVTVTYQAPARVFSTAAESTTHQGAPLDVGDRAGVLGIAAAAPRKNTDGILRAYARLPESVQKQHALTLVCTHADVASGVREKVATLGLDPHVRILQGVTNEQLAGLYRAARVFVFPSLEEGFGLPPLEAMACGTPVIASNTSSLPEVCGDAALLIEPNDDVALANSIAEVLTNQDLAGGLQQRGFIRSRQFSWQQTARDTIAVYESVAQNYR